MTKPVNIMHNVSPPDCVKANKKGFPLNIFQVAGYMQ